MKIALIADLLTHTSLQDEVNIRSITPYNYKLILKYWKPDLLFVESAWQGYRGRWKYKIASYPDYPTRNNKQLENVVEYAKNLGIPTVFWNKEDGVHFDRFIDSAKLFDYIFTVDKNCIAKYKKIVNSDIQINTLMFSVQSKIHYFDGFNFKYNKANFVGSYSTHVHNKRREWQDMLFTVAKEIDFNIAIYDRNSNRKAQHYRYPNISNLEVNHAVSYRRTAQVYKEHILSLNVNTIEKSPTMFSRRLIEILACGGISVTNRTDAVDNMFSEYCHVLESKEEAKELFYRVKKDGLRQHDYEMAKAGAEYIKQHHTWTHRIEEIRKIIEI